MKRLAWLCAVLLLSLSAARAQPDTLPEVTRVIQNQLAAFEADDFDTAFGLASPGIQRQFGSVQRFRLTVIHNYPMIWRSAGVQYLSFVERGGQVLQRVLITDRNNTLHLLLYEMVKIGNGWRVGGVRILPIPKTNT